MKAHENEPFKGSEPSTTYQYAVTPYDQSLLKELEKEGQKPIIVALFDEYDGAQNASYAINQFRHEGCRVIPFSPQEGLTHLKSKEFRETEFIDGIFLPGGSDVPIRSAHNDRKECEEGLIDFAEKNDIPLLGICRGQQILGYHNGLYLKSFSDEKIATHYNHANKIRKATHTFQVNNDVSVYRGSLIFNALSAKIFGQSDAKKYDYNVACMHHQLLTPSLLTNPKIQVTHIDENDNSIEGIQMSTGKYMTLGYQHHPETITTPAREQRAEKLESIREERDNADMFHYQDPEMVLLSAYKAKQKSDAANEQSTEEKIATVELQALSDQAKHKFLDRQFGESIAPAPQSPYLYRLFRPFLSQNLAPHRLKNEARKLTQS